MRKIIAIFFLIIGNLTTQAQEHFEVEASTGWNFYNYFNEDADLLDRYVGYGLQYGLDVWYSKKVNNTFDTRLGLGRVLNKRCLSLNYLT